MTTKSANLLVITVVVLLGLLMTNVEFTKADVRVAQKCFQCSWYTDNNRTAYHTNDTARQSCGPDSETTGKMSLSRTCPPDPKTGMTKYDYGCFVTYTRVGNEYISIVRGCFDKRDGNPLKDIVTHKPVEEGQEDKDKEGNPKPPDKLPEDAPRCGPWIRDCKTSSTAVRECYCTQFHECNQFEASFVHLPEIKNCNFGIMEASSRIIVFIGLLISGPLCHLLQITF